MNPEKTIEEAREFAESHPDYVPPPPGAVPEVVDAVKTKAKNAETTPEGYTLEEINGQLLLMPVDPSKHRPVDESVPPKQQETFIIYTVVEVVGGQNYLQPIPFHAHPVEDSEATDPLNPGNGEGEKGVAGQSETFASINGQYYPLQRILLSLSRSQNIWFLLGVMVKRSCRSG